MADIGFHYYFGKEVYGLHDYEQFYKDIYRKGFLHAKKHWRYLSHFEKFWFDNKQIDFDFSVALFGFEQAQKYTGTVYVDRNFFPMELSDYLEVNGYREKNNYCSVDNQFVEKQLTDYFQKSAMKDFEKQYFEYIKRSDLK
jgi:hypothetical protein